MENDYIPTIPGSDTPILLGNVLKGLNPRKIIVDLINAVSTRKYDSTYVDIINISKQESGKDRNTSASLQLLPDEGLFSAVVFHYNRIYTRVLGLVTILNGDSVTVYDALGKINRYLSISLTTLDVVNKPLPTPDANGYSNFYLDFKPECLLYYSGEQIYDKSGYNPNAILIDKVANELDRVDNTRDVLKPLSDAATQAISTAIITTEGYAKQYTDQAIATINTTSQTATVWDKTEW